MSLRFVIVNGRRIWDSVNGGFVGTEFLGTREELNTIVNRFNNTMGARGNDVPGLLGGNEYRERREAIVARIQRAAVHEWPF